MLQRVEQARNSSRNASRSPAVARLVPIDISPRVEKHVAARRRGRCLAIVDGEFSAPGERNQHEAAAAEIAGLRMRDSERETDGNRGIDRVAAGLQDIGANLSGDFLLRGDHAVFCDDGLKPRVKPDEGVGGWIVGALGIRLHRLHRDRNDGGKHCEHWEQSADF